LTDGGRWAFDEFTHIYAIPAGFDALIMRFIAGRTAYREVSHAD
jgi:hypothetical protein